MTSITPNQIISSNLGRARKARGWTQQETADKLGISRANYSLIEGSYQRDTRIRNHSADDLLIYSEVFQLPVIYFLLPPVEDNPEATVSMGDSELTMEEYTARVWPDFRMREIAESGLFAEFESRLVFLGMAFGWESIERVRRAIGPAVLAAQNNTIPEAVSLVTLLGETAEALERAETRLDELTRGVVQNVITPLLESVTSEAKEEHIQHFEKLIAEYLSGEETEGQ